MSSKSTNNLVANLLGNSVNNSKTSRLEEILLKEIKIITLEAIRLANNKFQKRNIKLEMKRLDKSIEVLPIVLKIFKEDTFR